MRAALDAALGVADDSALRLLRCLGAEDEAAEEEVALAFFAFALAFALFAARGLRLAVGSASSSSCSVSVSVLVFEGSADEAAADDARMA